MSHLPFHQQLDEVISMVREVGKRASQIKALRQRDGRGLSSQSAQSLVKLQGELRELASTLDKIAGQDQKSAAPDPAWLRDEFQQMQARHAARVKQHQELFGVYGGTI